MNWNHIKFKLIIKLAEKLNLNLNKSLLKNQKKISTMDYFNLGNHD